LKDWHVQVSDHLVQDALHKEQGKGPEPDDIIADLAGSKGVQSKLQQGRDSSGRNAKGGGRLS